MNEVRGVLAAAVLFLGAFGLHIVGGATDQSWLFAIAVGLIYLLATGFPWLASLLSGTRIRDTHRYFLPVTLVIALGGSRGQRFGRPATALSGPGTCRQHRSSCSP
jgi:hypothetical protein